MMQYSLPSNQIGDQNQSLLDRFSEGEEYRHLLLTKENETLPTDRRWVAIFPLLCVSSIWMARNAARASIEIDGFEGQVDYVLINYLKQRRMVVCACFDSDNDVVLWRLRQS